jgi:hypothetical protein
MTTKQTNKLNMIKTVNAFFVQEQAKFSTNTPLKTRIATLASQTAQLEIHADAQVTDTTADTAIKNNTHTQMIEHTVVFANAAADYFSDKNSPLEKQLSISASKLKRLSGVEAKIYCTKLYNVINENIAVLNPNYVTTAEAASLLVKINLFDAKTYDANLKIDTTQNATDFVKQDFQNITKSLLGIDRLMKKYSLSNKELLGKYKISRKIMDLGSRKAETTMTPA